MRWLDDKSRMSREVHVRIRERVGVRFPRATRHPHALTFDDALLALSRITYLYYEANGHRFVRLPRLDDLQTSIFKALGLTFPRSSAKAL
jgi:hypothetical protein